MKCINYVYETVQGQKRNIVIVSVFTFALTEYSLFSSLKEEENILYY